MSNVIVVLGMHRSGTSAVAGVVTKLGGAPPRHIMAADAGNARGYFESVAVRELHDDLLASAGSDWRDWRLFNSGWYRSAVAADYRARATRVFNAEFGDAALPVVKDPRICRFVPFWLDLLQEMGRTARFVLPIRSPLDVARSLRERDGLPLTAGMLLWLRHVLDAEAHTRRGARSIFAWNEFQADWRAVCDKITADTGLAWPRLSDRTAHDIDRFLTKDLVHHATDHAALAGRSDVHEWTLSAYDALLELTRNPLSNSALDTLDQIRGLLEPSSKMFGRVLVDYELDLEDLRCEVRSVTSERDGLQRRQAASETERVGTIDLVNRAEAAESALGEVARDKSTLSQTLAVTLDELADAQRDFAEAAREADEAKRKISELSGRARQREAEIAAANAALREAIDKSGELAKALRASEQDKAVALDRLDEALAAIEAERSEKAAMEAARAELTARVDRLASELQRVEQTSAERASATAAVHAQALAGVQTSHAAEVQALRGQLVDAEAARSHAMAAGRGTKLLPAALRRRLLAHRLVRSGLFDAAWYAATYVEVDESGLSAAEHYLEIGFCRGYRPNAYFDTRWYLARYEDVRRAGINPLLHYVMHGWREGRDPGPGFQTDYYLDANPDVRANDVNPLAHYLRYGRHEGRLPVRPL